MSIYSLSVDRCSWKERHQSNRGRTCVCKSLKGVLLPWRGVRGLWLCSGVWLVSSGIQRERQDSRFPSRTLQCNKKINIIHSTCWRQIKDIDMVRLSKALCSSSLLHSHTYAFKHQWQRAPMLTTESRVELIEQLALWSVDHWWPQLPCCSHLVYI